MGRNNLLLEKGGLKFPYPFPKHHLKLKEWLDQLSVQIKPEPFQPGLF